MFNQKGKIEGNTVKILTLPLHQHVRQKIGFYEIIYCL